jgi:hypothetical protein
MDVHNRRLRVFENCVLRRIFWHKNVEIARITRNCIMKSFMVCTVRKYYWDDHIKKDENVLDM